MPIMINIPTMACSGKPARHRASKDTLATAMLIGARSSIKLAMSAASLWPVMVTNTCSSCVRWSKVGAVRRAIAIPCARNGDWRSCQSSEKWMTAIATNVASAVTGNDCHSMNITAARPR